MTLISLQGSGVSKHPQQRLDHQWGTQRNYPFVTNVDLGLCEYFKTPEIYRHLVYPFITSSDSQPAAQNFVQVSPQHIHRNQLFIFCAYWVSVGVETSTM